jgi:type VI secretion system ImpC/EvpB family protein
MPANIEMDLIIGRNQAQRRRGPDEDGDGSAPLRLMVLGNFGGRAVPRPVAGVQPQRVDIDNLDAVLARLAGGLSLDLGSGNPVQLAPGSLDDLEPDALWAQLPLFKHLRDLRARLAHPATFEAAAAEMRAMEAPATPASDQPAAEDDTATLERLLGTQPAAAPARAAATGNDPAARLQALLQSVVAPHVVPATAHLQQPLVAALDRAAGQTLRGLLRHPQWRELEGHWRALDHFLRSVEGDNLVVELLDLRADELLQDLADAGGDVARSHLATLLASRAQRDGAAGLPTLWVALMDFGRRAPELALLAGLGALAAQAGGVLLAGAAPALVGIAAPAEPGDPAAWAPPAAAWQALRSSWVARHIGLVYPRLLGRLPYGPRQQPVAVLDFDELADGMAHERLAWRPAALAAAALMAQAHAEQGAGFNPAGHLDIDDLPACIDRSQDPPRLQAPAEAYLSDRQQQALHGLGVMPLASDRGSPRVRLGGWHSVAANGAPLAGP